jgi:hypothetical protein
MWFTGRIRWLEIGPSFFTPAFQPEFFCAGWRDIRTHLHIETCSGQSLARMDRQGVWLAGREGFLSPSLGDASTNQGRTVGLREITTVPQAHVAAPERDVVHRTDTHCERGGGLGRWMREMKGEGM